MVPHEKPMHFEIRGLCSRKYLPCPLLVYVLCLVKSAYKRKVWQSHPDLFPNHEKSIAESRFKLISEAYTCLRSGIRGDCSDSRYSYTQVVRTGVAMTNGRGRRNHTLIIAMPFLFITLGTVALGGSIATRAYNKQREECPSHNPFLP